MPHTRPVRSIIAIGFLFAYEKTLIPPASPIGSGCVYRPQELLYHRKMLYPRSVTAPPEALSSCSTSCPGKRSGWWRVLPARRDQIVPYGSYSARQSTV